MSNTDRTRILKVDIYELSIDGQVYKVLCAKNFTHPVLYLSEPGWTRYKDLQDKTAPEVR